MWVQPFFCIVFLRIGITTTNMIRNAEQCAVNVIRRDFRGEAIRIFRGEEVCAEATATDGVPLRHAHCFDVARISSLDATFEVVTKDLDTTSKVRNTFVVTTEEDLGGLRRIISTMKVTSYWNTRVLIVLIGESDESTVREVFGEIWNKTRLMNTVVMASAADGYTTLYSWYPYERGHCESLESVRVIDKCDGNGWFQMGNPFFIKGRVLGGLNGCPVRTTAAPSPFFAMYTKFPSEFSSGLDIKIVYELMKKYDMNIDLVLPLSMASHWFRTYPNGSLRGTMKMLFDYETDIGFSGLRLTIRTLPFLTFSHIYFLDSVRWAVPKTTVDQGWGKMLGIFSQDLWCAVVVTLVACSFLDYLLRRLTSTRSTLSFCFLEVFGLTVNQTPQYTPSPFTLKWFLICYTLYSMNVTTSFHSHLIGILTAPLLHSPYTSVEAAFRDGLTMYIPPFDDVYYRNDTLGEKILSSKQYRVMRAWSSVLDEVVINKTAAVLIGNARIKHLLSTKLHDGRGKPLADFIPGKVSTNLLAFHFSPNNPLKELFDGVLLRLLQAGLINKWRNDLWTPKGIGLDEEAIKPLSIFHLRFAFQLYGFSAVFAFVVLVFEILLFRVSVKNHS